jgi:hypothetical protein
MVGRGAVRLSAPLLLGIITLGLAIHVPASYGYDGPQEESRVEELVRQLLQGSGYGILRGGYSAADRSAAASVVRLGKAATPRLEELLRSLETQGKLSPAAGRAFWLACVYGRIEGKDATGTLVRMLRNPSLSFLRAELEQATAIATGVTTFRALQEGAGSDPAGSAPRRFGFRPELPQDTLDRFLAAWVTGNRSAMEKSLSRPALFSFRSFVGNQDFRRLRESMIREAGTDVVDVAFKLRLPPGLTRGPDPLSDETSFEFYPSVEGSATLFREGEACGTFAVRFLGRYDASNREFSEVVTYLLDNDDIGLLLRSVSRCLLRPREDSLGIR